MKARITVMLKNGVFDPQGRAIEGALASLGFEGIRSARQGKIIELALDGADPKAARAQITAMCEALLANPVMERYEIEIEGE